MDRGDVQRCLKRVPVIPVNDLEQVAKNVIIVHVKGHVTEELMKRRKAAINGTKPTTSGELVTVKRINLLDNRDEGIRAFINEVTALTVFGGQEGVPFFYGVTPRAGDPLPGIVKDFVGDPSSPRYLMLSEPLKLFQNTLLPLATNADWLCVALYIGRLIENLHKHFFRLGKTGEDELALDYNKLEFQRGQMSAFVVDLGNIEPLSTGDTTTGRRVVDTSDMFAEDVATFGRIIGHVGANRDVQFLTLLGDTCTDEVPRRRPALAEAIKVIEKAYALQMLDGYISNY